jgi:serine/threonine protein kinase
MRRLTPTPTPSGEKFAPTQRWCPHCSGDIRLQNSCNHEEVVAIDCPEPGTMIAGDYEYISLLGLGGMGVVYKCRNIHLDKVVAVKMLAARQYGPDDVVRFQKEARAAGKFNHPNLVSVLDFGTTDDGDPFMVMEYLEGRTLSELIADRTVDRNLLFSIFCDCCVGLANAHKHGVFHRDLKPANIMVVENEGRSYVKILDFGIAKIADAGRLDQTLTGQGLVFGTPPYMSPEQSVGDKLTDRCDVYSMGCVMYEAFTGRRPFESSNVLELVNLHQFEVPDLIGAALPDQKFPEELEALIASMLLKVPSQRPSMSIVANQLVKILEDEERLVLEAEAAKEQQNIEAVAGAKKTRRRAIIATTAAVFVATLAIIVWVLLRTGPKSSHSLRLQSDPSHELLPPELNDAVFMKQHSLTKIMNSRGTAVISFNDTDLFSDHLKLLVKDGNRCRRVRLINCNKVTAENLKILRSLGMSYLDIRGTDLDDEGMAVIATFENLVAIDLENIKDITNGGIRSLKRLPRLSEIAIRGMPFDEETIKIFSEMKLRMLELGMNKSFNENGLSVLRQSPITEVRLNDLNVTDRGLEMISKIPNLVFLRATRLKVGDRGFSTLVKAPKLVSFTVSYNEGITDQSAQTLVEIYRHQADHTNMEFVLDHTSFTAASLPEFKQLKGLKMLTLCGLKGFDKTALKELKTALPGTIIDRTDKHDNHHRPLTETFLGGLSD